MKNFKVEYLIKIYAINILKMRKKKTNTSWNNVETTSNFNVEKTFDFVKMYQRWNLTLFQRWNLALFQRRNTTLFQRWNLTLFQCWNLTLFQRWNLPLFQRWNPKLIQRWNLTLFFNVEIWRWTTFNNVKMDCFSYVEITNIVSTLKIGCSTSRPKINLVQRRDLKSTLKQRWNNFVCRLG